VGADVFGLQEAGLDVMLIFVIFVGLTLIFAKYLKPLPVSFRFFTSCLLGLEGVQTVLWPLVPILSHVCTRVKIHLNFIFLITKLFSILTLNLLSFSSTAVLFSVSLEFVIDVVVVKAVVGEMMVVVVLLLIIVVG